MSCPLLDLQHRFEVYADDIQAALRRGFAGKGGVRANHIRAETWREAAKEIAGIREELSLTAKKVVIVSEHE